MRERLVAVFVGLTILVVTLYGVPRAYFLADLVRSQEQVRVDRTADVLAPLLEERASAGRPLTSAYLRGLAGPGEVLTVTGGPDGDRLSGGLPGDRDGAVWAARPLAGGGEVTVLRTASVVGDEVARAILPLVLLGVLLTALAALAGFVIAGRLARPFRELAGVARGLGEGKLHPTVPRYSVPEARAIGRALEEAGRRLDLLLARERHVAVHASHELRTPVTALRLELEDLAHWRETPPTVAAALDHGVAELDRLSTAITELLELADSHRAAMEIDLDLDVLLADLVARRAGAGVPVEHRPGPGAPTRLDPLPVLQTLDLLIGLLASTGCERVALSVAPLATHHELRLQAVRPVPAGPVPDTGADQRWPQASDLAAAAGGQLRREGDTVLLRLPRREMSVIPAQ